jgi:hypothetical protein
MRLAPDAVTIPSSDDQGASHVRMELTIVLERSFFHRPVTPRLSHVNDAGF